MFIVGIDPSLRHTGLSVAYADADQPATPFSLRLIETVAAKRPDRRSFDDLDCAGQLLGGIEAFLDDYAVGAQDVIVVEIPSGARSARASWALGIVLGMVAAVEQRFPGRVVRVTPREVKQHFTGDPNAAKETMTQTAIDRYPALPWLRHRGRLVAKNEHLADAVAVLMRGAADPAVQHHLNPRST